MARPPPWLRISRMRILPLLLLLAVPFTVRAQDDEGPTGGGEVVTAGDAITREMCEKLRDLVIPRIEAYTRMKFRRPIPIQLEPLAVWQNKIQQDGFAGQAGRHALAYYTPSQNIVTVVPWVIGGYLGGNPGKKSRDEWYADLEPTMIHELCHGIHHQNFYTEGRNYAASLKPRPTDSEVERSTVDFLMGEGVPELVSLRTTDFIQNMHRHPRQELSGPIQYMRQYSPDGKQPYRMKLMALGYVDGLDLMHQISLRAGARGIRAILYRPPPMPLLFQPDILGTVDLDDPPDPDSVFGFLSPEILKGMEVRLAVNPGHGRYFDSAYRTGIRQEGCLLGYVAEVGSDTGPYGTSRYAFWVSDPDHPASWRHDQAASLKALNPAAAKEKQVSTTSVRGHPIKATVIHVPLDDGSLYVRAEAEGLVVLAHESKPTKNLEERVVLALRSLWLRKPQPKVYDAALKKALENIPASMRSGGGEAPGDGGGGDGGGDDGGFDEGGD